MTVTVLVLLDTIDDYLPLLKDSGFRLIVARTADETAAAIRTSAAEVRAVLTRGSTGLSAGQIAALPGLEIICALGAGYENVDLAAAAARGIVVTNGASLNAVSVADHAMALLLAAVRNIAQADAAVRRGEWTRLVRPSISHKRLGILGLGAIGAAIAQRGALGFGMSVRYHNRRPRADVAYEYCSTVVELAQASDFLVIATPGGAGTRHLVDAAVLRALGAQGFLVNIARGSVLDTQALIEALQRQWIAGAALDVVEGEPEVPPALKRQANLVLTPHIAGLTPEAMAATVQQVVDNLLAHFSGRPVLTPVPLP